MEVERSGVVARRDYLHRRDLQERREAHVRQGCVIEGSCEAVQLQSRRQHAARDRFSRRRCDRRRCTEGADSCCRGREQVRAMKKATKPKLLSGGNPQIAKGDGDAPVQAYIAASPGWKRDLGRRLDALITGAVPKVHKAVKWNSPFYAVASQGWFLS